EDPPFDGRGRLNGLLFADVPAMNSLESILMFCERPAVQGQLHRLERRLGK
ncbi:Syn, partial [Symbiodinium pilosum]